MNEAPRHGGRRSDGEVVDFDAALLAACPPDGLDAVMAEAELLARALAPQGRAAQIEALARDLQSGMRDLEKGRRHAILLAAALRRLARKAAD